LSLPSLIPLTATLAALARPDSDTLHHLWQYVLPQVAGNTAWLLLGVGAGTAVLGTALAALVALCEFPGRRWFSWLLVLPLAMPGYVLAVAFIEWLSDGPAQELFAGENLEYPANPAVATDPLIAAWGDYRQDLINVSEAGAMQAEAVKLMDRAGYR
jgi:ABC-type Fe3+ transport system permease subunit